MMSASSTDTESGGSSSVGKGSFSSADLRPKPTSSREWCRLQFGESHLWAWTLILLSLVLILLSILTGLLILNAKDKGEHNLCLRKDCITAAADILTNMDPQVNPCTDFYEYACGGWMRSNSISDDDSRADTYSVIRNQMSEKLKLLLETPISPDESAAIRKVKHFYASCTDVKTIENRTEQPLLALLDQDFGGWSLIGRENAKWTSMDWVTTMGILRKYNNEIIVGHNVGPSDVNSTLYAIKIYPAGLGMSSVDFYGNKTSKNYLSYRKLILNVASLLGAANGTTVQKDVDDLLELEVKLANISRVYEKFGGAAYQRMPLNRLSKLVPKINWTAYFEKAIPLPLNETEAIGVFGFDYFLDLQEIVGVTPERTIKNYLVWRFTMNRVKNLDARFENALEDYYRDQYGTKSVPARWKKCVDFANGNLGTAVSALYVRKYFDLESKHKAVEMIENIRQEFIHQLDSIDWIDAETRVDAIRKAHNIEVYMGFPEYILNATLLDKEYEHLEFDNSTYFENVVGFLQNSTAKTQGKLYSADDRSKWNVAPTVVNANYHRFRNSISFPAAILQKPLYSKVYPASLNYGAIGSVIGHELTHGFDSNGRHHDPDGNQRLWWHPRTVERFISKSACMISQYNNYTVSVNGETINGNGVLTLGENIADNGGIRISYKAFKKVQSKDRNASPHLPGLEMTHDQLFFLKFAQNWCQIMTDEGMIDSLKTWRHSLGRFRVLGTLSNSREFADAYQCKPGSAMNPTEKCQVW